MFYLVKRLNITNKFFFRCVAIFDKATALGVKATALCAAYIIYPLIFGALTDSSCLVWEEACQDTGACWVYNAQDLG